MMAKPLLRLSEERVQYELRRVRTAAHDHRRYVIHNRWLLTASILEFLVGWSLIGLAFHVTGEDAGHAFFFGGLLVGYLGPVWTWLLPRWRGGEGM